jgi:hypothetical protein
MEKLTVSRIGEVKTINYTSKKTGKPDSFNKVGFLTSEYGDRWFDVTFRGNVPIEIGNSYNFEIKSREYNGKTYWDAELPRAAKGGGMSDADKSLLDQAAKNSYAALIEIQTTKKFLIELATRLKDAGVIKGPATSDGTPVPNFGAEEEDPLMGVDPFAS